MIQITRACILITETPPQWHQAQNLPTPDIYVSQIDAMDKKDT